MKEGDRVIFYRQRASKATEKIEAVLLKLNKYRATIEFADKTTAFVLLENIEKKNGTKITPKEHQPI